jgi:hypothetical protein
MFNAVLPNELILIAAAAIAHPSCGKMTFSMLDTAEWQVLINLDRSVGSQSEDVYFIVRYRPLMPMQITVTDSYGYDPNALEKTFVSLPDCVDLAIAHWRQIDDDYQKHIAA